ncbi:MAG: HPr kinase/phosphatase C-terminal domain-containing protein [Alphaproteobacteria bacterium]|nr:HPr kinase/phosphatase C-terminal domain-containing protein [Alphaproteobacteria bacterium]
MALVHGTTIAIDGRGILLRGVSGAGKSDLALRMIDAGAELVADDQTTLTVDAGTLYAQAPEQLQGRIEVRGVGIMTLPYRTKVAVELLADLTQGPIDRLPDCSQETLEGITLPCLTIAPFESSAPIKLKLALLQGFGEPA